MLNDLFKIAGNSLVTLGIGTLIGSIVTIWIKDKLEQNTENKRRLRDARERQYKDLLSNLLAFFEGWDNKDQKKQFMRELYTSAPVYASDEVIKLANKFIESFKSRELRHNSDKIYAQLVLAIRRELNKIQGDTKTRLREKDIIVSKLD